MYLIILVLLFFLLIAFSIPIAFVIIIVAGIGLYLNEIPLTMLPQMMIQGVNSQTLIAVPLYIFAGEIMNRGGITQKIFDFALSLVGHIKGGLGHVNVLASMIFAGVSGSATADAAGLGRIEMNAMEREGYDIEFSAGITAASSTIGPIIPPSIHLLIYGAVAEVSAAKLFIAGIFPGVIMGILLMAAIYILASTGKYNCPTRKRSSLKEILFRFKDALSALFTPVLIVGAIMTGIVTPTEAGIIAVVYSLVLGFIYRQLNVRVIRTCLKNTIYSTAVVMFMLAVSRAFAWFITIEKIPEMIVNTIYMYTDSPLIILFLMNIVLLLLGMVGTASSNIVIVTPIFMTIAASLGMDPVHLGIIIVLGLMIGLITPPVGTSLYILADVARIPFERVAKATAIFTIPLIAALYLITYFPEISLFLLKLVY